MGKLFDPKAMSSAQLREVVRATHKVLSNTWVPMADAFRYFKGKELWKEWGLNSWAEYKRSDLPGLAPSSVESMIHGLNFLESLVPDIIRAILNGEEVNVCLPDWPTVRILANLKSKVLSPKDESLIRAAGLLPSGVSQGEFDKIFYAAINGECTPIEAREQAQNLIKGVVSTSKDKKSTVSSRAKHLSNYLYRAASEARAIGRMKGKKNFPFIHQVNVKRGALSLLEELYKGMGPDSFHALIRQVELGVDLTEVENPTAYITKRSSC